MLDVYVAWKRLFVYLPTVLTLAAMEEADKEADNDGRTEHRQRNDQRLKVYCHQEKKENFVSVPKPAPHDLKKNNNTYFYYSIYL